MKRVWTILALLGPAVLSHAVTLELQWLVGSGNWSTTTNWSTGLLPTGADDVRIDPLDSYSAVVTVNVAANTGNLTIGTNDSVVIPNNLSLTFDGGGGTSTLGLNSGSTVSLNSSGNATRLLIQNGDLTVNGAGTVKLSNNTANQIYGLNTTNLLLNQSTIEGAGSIGLNSLTIRNEGTITALYANPLTIDPAAGSTFVNSGTLQAASGGLLVLASDTFNNISGTIHAADSGQVRLSGITLKGGVLSTAGTGSMYVSNTSTFSDGVVIAANSTFLIPNAIQLNFADTLTIDGTLAMASSGNASDLVAVAASTTLSGQGKITLSNNGANRIYASNGTDLIINQVTIEGAGQIGANSASIQNEGTIRALYSNALVLDPAASGTFTNTGQIIAETGSVLALTTGSFINTGGQITAEAGGKIQLAAGVSITGGTLSSLGSGYLENNNSGSFSDVTLTTGSDLRVHNNTTLSLANTFSNAGVVALGSVGNATDLIISTPTMSLSGGGLITLSSNSANRIYGSVGTYHLTNIDNVIRGSGQLGANQLVFTNQGVIEANNSGSTLTLDPATSPFLNTGTYRAVNGGILVLSTGVFDNSGGTIQSQTGSTVRLSGTSVSAGTLDIGPSATLELNSSSFQNGTLTTASGSNLRTVGGLSTLGGSIDLTPDAFLTLDNNTSLKLLASGTYAIDGTIRLSSVGNASDLILSGGDVTLGGSGKLNLDNNSANRIYGLTSTDRLILNGVNLEGGGNLGLNLLGVVNQGVITANDPTILTIDPSAAGFTNAGTLKADGGTLNLTSGTYNSTGGFIESTSGSVVQFSNTAFTAGILQGPGTFRTTGPASFSNLNINSGTALTISNNTAVTFFGLLQNQGRVDLTSVGNLTDFIVGTGDLTLSGGGTLDLGPNSANRIFGQTATIKLTNTDNVIRGAGQLGSDQLVVDNHGTISANLSGQSLVIDVSSPGLTNSGLLEASNGGILRLQNSLISNQSGGILQADSSSSIWFSGTTLSQGSLAGSGSIRSITANTFIDLTLNAATTLTLDNNTATTFSGTLHNAGSINFQSVGNLTDLIAGSGGLTLTGGGTLNLNSNFANRVYGITSATPIVNVDNAINGFGQIGSNQLDLDNRATINANVNGQTLRLDTSSGFKNSGTIQSTHGGILEIFDSSLDNTGGTLSGDSGSNFILNGSSITSGSLSGTFSIGSTASTLDTVSILPGTQISLPNNHRLNLKGTINHEGTITATSVGNLTDLVIDASGATLSGTGGRISLGGSAARLYGANSGTTLVLGSDQTIHGYGQLGGNQLQLNQFGTIRADSTAPLTVDLSSPLQNFGTLEAVGSGGLVVNDAVSNHHDIAIAAGSSLTLPANPLVQVAGRTELAGGTLSATSLQFDGGDLIGHGSIVGHVSLTNAKLIANDGLLALNSTLTLDSGTTMFLEISGPTAATDYGNLSATDIFLDGQLFVRFGGGFENSILVSDTFAILVASNSLSGTFQNVAPGFRLPTFDGLGSFAVNYDSFSVSLSDFQPVPEPSTTLLLLVGLSALILPRRQRR